MIITLSKLVGQTVNYKGVEYKVKYIKQFTNSKSLKVVDKNGNEMLMSETTFRKYRRLEGLENNLLRKPPLFCKDCAVSRKKRCPVCADLRKNRNLRHKQVWKENNKMNYLI